MYAVVEIQGSQFKVSKDQKLYVNRIDAKEGSKVSFDKVLLLDDGKKVQVGKPCLLYTSPSPRDRQKSRMPSSA